MNEFNNSFDGEAVILAIETSCDETCAAVVAGGRRVLSNIVYSQIDLHRKHGGVVPEIASRSHLEKVDRVVADAMSESGLTFHGLDAVAVTSGPGLVGALLVGVSYGKALSYAIKKPLIAVHHIEGHICANYLEDSSPRDFKPPYMCLVASGGHTTLSYVPDYGVYETMGKTRDDAAGEAFDKVARLLGLPYPGGVEIDRLAAKGRRDAIKFPRAAFSDGTLDFSFSGVKSAVAGFLGKKENQDFPKADVAASFQEAVTSVLAERAVQACKAKDCRILALAGGVAANSRLRSLVSEACGAEGITLKIPPVKYCTDNAAMIGAAACAKYTKGEFAQLNLNAYPSLPLGAKFVT